MPEYRLSILVEGAENGASDVLGRLSGGLGALNVAMGNLIADGLKAATGALVEFGRQGLAVATDYQSSLNMFQAVSGATGDQMAAIAAEAKRLGGDMSLPATSAGDAARAMTELAKAGLSVDNALKAGKGTLQLAAAGNLDEAQAAEIAANALNSFGLAGDKAAMVADLFAAAANKSSLEVTDVADGFKMASAVFAAFQGPVVGSEKALKDLTTAMALLGNVGIKGSEAGTSLKQMLLQLSGPSSTAKDAMAGLMYNAMGASGGIAQLDTILGGKAKDRTDALKALAAANPDIAKMGDIAYDSAGKMIDSLGLWRGLERTLLSPGGRIPVPFARFVAYDARGATLVIGPTDSVDVSVFDGTRLISRFTARMPGRQPTDADRDAS